MRRLVIAVTVALALAVGTTLFFAVDAAPESSPNGASRSSTAGADEPTTAAERFFDRYVTGAGRVVRHDQGGDTVSEGQAYALRIALEADRQDRFVRIWRWTRRHLQRDDGLFAWRWHDGRVVDPEPAADADVDVAVALADASRRFERPGMARAAARIAASVLAHETITTDGRQLLAAGPWAVSRRVVNPSYSTPCGFRVLGELTGDSRWARLADDFAAALAELLDRTRLPPDWAVVDDGVLVPAGAPDTGRAPSYGLDAARIGIRLATCGGRARQLSARLWPRLRTLPRHGGAVAYSLQGAATTTANHPVGLLGAALSAAAAGERDAANRLVARARHWERRAPTYYGAAWLALVEPEVDRVGSGEAAPVAAQPASPTRVVLVAARPVAAAPPPPSTAPTTTTTSGTTTSTRPPTSTTSTTQPATSTTSPSSTTTTRSRARPPAATHAPAPPGAPPAPPGPSVAPPSGVQGGPPPARSSARSGAPSAPLPPPTEVALGRLSPRELVPSARPDARASRAEIRFRRVSGVLVAGLVAAVVVAAALGLVERSRIRPRSNGTS